MDDPSFPNKSLTEAHRTKSILDNLGNGFFSVNRDWIFTYSNPAATSALGLPPEEVVGKHVWTLHPHLVDSEFYHAYHRSMNERVVAEVTNYYPEQNRWYHTVSYPLDEGIAVSFTDITKRKQAELERTLAEERFQTLTEAMPQMVWITEPDGKAVYFNARWPERTGTTLEENLGDGWINVLHPEDRETTFTKWQSALQSRLYDVEYRVRMADGSYRWHVARGVPTIGEDGKIKQWVGTTTDIHDQKMIQEELKRAVKSRDEFLSIASHELKTPLTVIKLQSELGKRTENKTSLMKISETLGRSVDRLTRVVDDMLDISRIATGKLTLHLEEVNLSEVILETVERMKPLFEAAGSDYRVLVQEEIKARVDRFRIEQVLVNLLTNAARYGAGKPIFISAELLKDSVRVTVKDHGVGIPPEDHTRIFERFERATTDPGIAGLGLGLFIVSNILRLHGGSIAVNSEVREGAEFTVILPLNESPARGRPA